MNDFSTIIELIATLAGLRIAAAGVFMVFLAASRSLIPGNFRIGKRFQIGAGGILIALLGIYLAAFSIGII